MPDPWTTSASASLASADGIVTLVEGSAFCISNRSGEIDPVHPQGLFFRDTRFLSQMHLLLNGATPEPLAATAADPFSGVFVLRGLPAKGHADSHLVVHRRRYVGRGMREDIEIENFGEEAAFCSVELLLGADFADLFEVKEGRVREAGRAQRRGRGWTADLQVQAPLVRPRHAHRLQRPAALRRAARHVRDGRATSRPLVDLHRGDAGDRRSRGDAALPVRTARRAVDARRTTGGVEGADAGGVRRPRPVPLVARTLDAGPRRPADLRPRVPRPGGRGRGRAVVHDAVRTRLADHVVDDDSRRPRPRARHVADPCPFPGQGGRRAHRGGTGPHPARDAFRRDGVARARRRARVLRHRGRHTPVRHARRRAVPVGKPARRGGRALARRRRRVAVDHRLRRQGRRRLRRVPAHHGSRLAEPGLEGLVGLDAIPRRLARADADRVVRGAGLRLRRARRSEPLRDRGRRSRARIVARRPGR